jgi:hypothetical protein
MGLGTLRFDCGNQVGMEQDAPDQLIGMIVVAISLGSSKVTVA